MEEQTRIQNLQNQGKITKEEAELLLEALKDSEDLEEVVTQHQAAKLVLPETQSPGGHWLKVDIAAGNLKIRADPSLSRPTIHSNGLTSPTLVESNGDYHLELGGNHTGGLFGFFKGAFASDMEISVPADLGVLVSARAGNVEVFGVRNLKAHVRAGNLVVCEVGGLEAEITAGRLEAKLKLVSGNYKVSVMTGNADITLMEGSSYQLEGRVSMGDISVSGRQEAHASGLGQSISLTEKGGEAKLRIDVKMGSCNIASL